MKKFLISIILVLVVIFGVLIYSRFIGVRGLDTNEIVINTNISEGYDGLKIVHFSDLHYKKVITEKVDDAWKAVKDKVKDIKVPKTKMLAPARFAICNVSLFMPPST